MKKLSNLIDDYLVYLRSLNYSPDTIRCAKKNLLRFNQWLLDMYQLTEVMDLSQDKLLKWHGHLSTLFTAQGYPLKSTTINRYILAVRGLLKYLGKSGFVRHDLDEALPYLKEPKRLPGNVLPHAQVKKLLAKVSTGSSEGYRNRAILELLYTSGIRIRELLELNVEDVNLEHKAALVTGKGDKERMVPIGKTALIFLESYVVAVRPYLLRDRAEKALFIGKDGGRFSYSSFRRMLANVTSLTGIDETITAHTFRRSCTTELIRSGANMYHVKELLGHESLETLKHYAKLSITDLKKTHEKCHPREKDSR